MSHAVATRICNRSARLIRRARLFSGVGMAGTVFGALWLTGCSDRRHQIVVSVPDQRLAVLKDGQPLATYPVSTSRFGAGDGPGTCSTPLGDLEVAQKIGNGAPLGAVFKSRRPTGEVLVPDAPGRDPVVTRILWLRGLQTNNQHAYGRYIYIHGTPEERNIGRPASYGCVRMRSRDVARLYDEVGRGTGVRISNESLAGAMAPFLAPGTSLSPPMQPRASVTEDSFTAPSQ